MNELETLFQKRETRLGVFYPTDYIVASFHSFEAANSAFDALRHAGFKEEDARAVPGSDVLDYLDELKEETGFWGRMMTEFSRVIDTEASFLDYDVQQAKRGAGFLVVRCLSEDDAARIRGLVLPSRPLAMQWYTAGAVQSMV
ncbi:MAG TPA: hypothetical protein VH639_25355 [Bryobacteraceae bacterium]|jgi:hypothetical protein